MQISVYLLTDLPGELNIANQSCFIETFLFWYMTVRPYMLVLLGLSLVYPWNIHMLFLYQDKFLYTHSFKYATYTLISPNNCITSTTVQCSHASHFQVVQSHLKLYKRLTGHPLPPLVYSSHAFSLMIHSLRDSIIQPVEN